MSRHNPILKRFVESVGRFIEAERERCNSPYGNVVLPAFDLEAAKFVADRISSYLHGKSKTLDQAFSSGRRGRPAGSGKKLSAALEAERLMDGGASVSKTAKAVGAQRIEVKARRQRYGAQIMAAKIVEGVKRKRGG